MRTQWTISGFPPAHRAPSLRLLVAGVVIAGAAVTAACSSNDVAARERTAVQANPASLRDASANVVPVASPDSAIPQAGVVVTCPPGTQAFITPATANGRAVSQVTCVSDETTGPQQPMGAVPVTYSNAPSAYGVMPAATPAVIRTVEPAAERVVYTEPRRVTGTSQTVRRPARTWKKSAVIIGSSAGVGAGLGAAFGGKKGALIGAAVGGGGAAIWDQTTRRR